MFSVPEGRAANQPDFATTFRPPMGALFPGALVNLATMGSPANSVSLTESAESFCSSRFWSGEARIDPGIKWTAKFRSQFTVMQAGIFSGSSGDLCGQKIHD